MKTEFKTPKGLFWELKREFNFTLDVCALSWNAQCKSYFTPEDNGLLKKWSGVCWCNPPFDKTQGQWVRKAWEEAQNGCTVVLLFPGNYHDTQRLHRFALRSSEIRYFRGRPKFKNKSGKENAMRCILLVFRPGCSGPPEVSSITRDGAQYNFEAVENPATNAGSQPGKK